MIKKVEEMDFYDLLNLRADASPKEIEDAYLLALATYHQEGLASYGALGDEDRALMLNKIEEAFETLRDPQKKSAYDAIILARRPEFQKRAYYRRTTHRQEIEDAQESMTFWDRMRAATKSSRRHGNGPKDDHDRPLPEALSGDFYYYGDYLKKVRERKGLSREEVAERCGIGPDRIKALESEAPAPHLFKRETFQELNLYAKGLGLGPVKGQNPLFSDRLDE